LLLAIAALQAPRVEASRTSVWERNPPAAAFVAEADAASVLPSLTPAAAADIEAVEPPLFDRSRRDHRREISLSDRPRRSVPGVAAAAVFEEPPAAIAALLRGIIDDVGEGEHVVGGP
jgi:hypothetical protein